MGRSKKVEMIDRYIEINQGWKIKSMPKDAECRGCDTIKGTIVMRESMTGPRVRYEREELATTELRNIILHLQGSDGSGS